MCWPSPGDDVRNPYTRLGSGHRHPGRVALGSYQKGSGRSISARERALPKRERNYPSAKQRPQESRLRAKERHLRETDLIGKLLAGKQLEQMFI
ncbi:MAG TPA: hypothetical protein VGE97_00465 [Nitrososphaera sp.]